jgi:hypothetical protein
MSSQAAMHEAMLLRRENDVSAREQAADESRAELAAKASESRKRELEMNAEHSVRPHCSAQSCHDRPVFTVLRMHTLSFGQRQMAKLKTKLSEVESRELELLALDRRLRKHASKLEQVFCPCYLVAQFATFTLRQPPIPFLNCLFA